jgi:hypothetical protein
VVYSEGHTAVAVVTAEDVAVAAACAIGAPTGVSDRQSLPPPRQRAMPPRK